MSYSLHLGKFLKELSGPNGRSALQSEFDKIRAEVKNITKSVKPEAEKRLMKVQAKLKLLLKDFEKGQDYVEKELSKSLKQIRTAARDTEAKIQKALSNATKLKPAKKAKKTATKVASKFAGVSSKLAAARGKKVRK